MSPDLPKSRRLTAADWTRAATNALAAGGFGDIAVEPIAKQLGVTKGSFYSHFSCRGDLVASVLKHWLTTDTDEVIVSLSETDDPYQRLVRFLEIGFERDDWGRVFAALCSSASEPEVQPIMDEVRARRLSLLTSSLRQLGLQRWEAEDRATLIYASYVGFWRLVAASPDWTYNSPKLRRRFAAQVIAQLLPDPPPSALS